MVLVDSFCDPLLLRGLAVPGPGLFMPNACFSCSLEMKAAQQDKASGGLLVSKQPLIAGVLACCIMPIWDCYCWVSLTCLYSRHSWPAWHN